MQFLPQVEVFYIYVQKKFQKIMGNSSLISKIQSVNLNHLQGGHIVAKMKFPVFSLCYINFPCIIFMQKLAISSMNNLIF